MGRIIGSAFADAWPLLAKRKVLYGIFAALAALAGFYATTVPKSFSTSGTMYGAQMPSFYYGNVQLFIGIDAVVALGQIPIWFVLADVVRTIDPAFRMTVGRFFGLIGISLVCGIALSIGAALPYGIALWLLLSAQNATIWVFLLFLVAHVYVFWIGMKWSQIAWTYLLGDPPNPFAASWRMTTGRFWQTLGFLLIVGILTGIILEVVGGLALWLGTLVPFLGILTVPLVFLLYVWIVCFAYLAEARWYLQLRTHAATR
jgi:hypothetical protein